MLFMCSLCMTMSPYMSLFVFLSVQLVGETAKLEGGISYCETAGTVVMSSYRITDHAGLPACALVPFFWK